MQIEIEKLTFGGAGIGRADGKVVFVKGGLPGEVLRIKLTKVKGRYAEGCIEEVLRPSSERTRATCPVFDECGGCQWQHVKYSAQLRAKEHILRETLERIGGLKGIEIEPIVPSPKEYGYRNRVTLSAWFQDGMYRIGYHKERSRRLVEIQGCPIASLAIDESISRLSKLLSSIDTPRYPLWKIHIASYNNTILISLVPFRDKDPRKLNPLRDLIKESLGVESVSISGDEEEEFKFIQSGLMFYSTPSAFVQSNKEINERLTETLIDWADPKGHERVLDLYCGVGNFSLPIAKKVRDVVAVDISGKAVTLAKKSAGANGVSNGFFNPSPAQHFVEESLKVGDKFDLVIVDPPREGAKVILEGLGQLSPEKIIYVSCDPPTLARDLKTLTQIGYRVLKIRPFDMFPQTYHIESLSLLVKV